MTPSAVATSDATTAISALCISAPVSSPFPNASWNHLVVNPDSGSVGVVLSFTENTMSTTSGANRKITNAMK